MTIALAGGLEVLAWVLAAYFSARIVNNVIGWVRTAMRARRGY